MARGGNGLLKVTLGPAMPYPFMPCRQATYETAIWPFQGWPSCTAGVLQPSSTPLDTPRRTPIVVKEGTVNQNELISGFGIT
jgi:hypothetical protein